MGANDKVKKVFQREEVLLPAGSTSYSIVTNNEGDKVVYATLAFESGDRKQFAFTVSDKEPKYEERETEDGKTVRVKVSDGVKCPLTKAQQKQFSDLLEVFHLAAAKQAEFI